MKSIERLDPWLVAVLSETEMSLRGIFGDRLERVVLYGSFARGDSERDSDIDIIALVNDEKQALDEMDDAITDVAIDLTTKHGVLVSLYIESVATYNRHRTVLPFFRNVDREGITFYEH